MGFNAGHRTRCDTEQVYYRPVRFNSHNLLAIHPTLISVIIHGRTVYFTLILGLLSHHVFRCYEPTIKRSAASLLSPQALFVIYLWASQVPISSGVLALSFAIFKTLYLASLSSSNLVYTMFFHPLRRYLGPPIDPVIVSGNDTPSSLRICG